ncbi:hypothetical protein RHGRI_013912 [Rhododendron griersonianum]|uniref:KIB1-4 beta-propeller domain-containing protein n=1 Tax=Rhododendron griersonianum TaxID=479676 RepID=A0AAV6K7E5_9ERIC|nr:hypothetical protein RHGRI_013912 [Rhododendron griersonianum]
MGLKSKKGKQSPLRKKTTIPRPWPTLAVIEEIDSRLRITGLSKSRAVPSVPSMHFKEYLVESNGEILLVFLIMSRKSIRSVDNVEVYRLRFDTISWVKMERIGDIGHCSWGLIVVCQSTQVKLDA